MNYRIIVCLLGCAVLTAQDSSHDAPLELVNNTVHAFFRTDTLIDRQLARTGFGMTENQIFQHTHKWGHTLRISIPGMPYVMIAISPTDQLHFRLSGNRGSVIVAPRDILGIGGLVAGHAAEAGGPVVRNPPYPGSPEQRRAYINKESSKVVSKLSPAHKHSINTVWVVQGPAGYTWAPQQKKTDESISTEIANIGTYPDHKKARAAARPIEYLLQDKQGQTDFFMERLFITNNGTVTGEGICLPRDARVVVCENEYDSVAKKPVAVCPPRVGNKL